ncbi:MAG: hypothetical protein FWD64_03575 [Acidobacteriaceae bacterium]|nr:hypothetical protein [Acidobacteriaceae bacterium]
MSLIDPNGLECVWDDGSYDSEDDPDTGSPEKCAAAGGTWYDHSFFAGMPDWSGDPDAIDGIWDSLFNPFGLDPNGKPLYCNADVISAMRTIWAQSANGTSGAEASFRLDGNTSNYSIVFTPFTNQRGSQTIQIKPGTTFALFHTHPNFGSWQPSTPQNNFEGNPLGDTGVADKYNLQMYVVSQRGLGYYDPATGTSTQVRPGTSWANPCGD